MFSNTCYEGALDADGVVIYLLLSLLQDVMMPEVDGLELLRFVRSNEELSNLPVISEWPRCTGMRPSQHVG